MTSGKVSFKRWAREKIRNESIEKQVRLSFPDLRESNSWKSGPGTMAAGGNGPRHASGTGVMHGRSYVDFCFGVVILPGTPSTTSSFLLHSIAQMQTFPSAVTLAQLRHQFPFKRSDSRALFPSNPPFSNIKVLYSLKLKVCYLLIGIKFTSA